MNRIVSHKELDQKLDEAALDPDLFEGLALELAESMDAEGVLLEVTSPETWRRGGESAQKPTFAQQFRADVDAILPMDREAEAHLARRIEFARLRLEKARREEGLLGEEGCALSLAGHLPPRIHRRSMELHALRTEMVERNLYLVLINVERYSSLGTNRLDLIQEGCISLYRAVDGFEWRRGLLFRTYAVHWLNQAFRNYLYNNSRTVRVPVYLQKALKHIDSARVRLGDPNAAPGDIAREADLDERLVVSAVGAAKASYSIDATIREDQGATRFSDVLVDEKLDGPYLTRFEDVSLESGLATAMEALSEREQFVLRQRFGVGQGREHTLAEVAQEIGVSVERVRQIQVRALERLDTPSLRRELDPFLN